MIASLGCAALVIASCSIKSPRVDPSRAANLQQLFNATIELMEEQNGKALPAVEQVVSRLEKSGYRLKEVVPGRVCDHYAITNAWEFEGGQIEPLSVVVAERFTHKGQTYVCMGGAVLVLQGEDYSKWLRDLTTNAKVR